MVRVSRNLRHAACLIICAGVAGCGSSSNNADNTPTTEGLISFDAEPAQPAHKGYSAFDGNIHDYQVVPNVPSASDMPSRSTQIPIPSSLVWTSKTPSEERSVHGCERGHPLTTKKAGTTTIKVSGKTMSGKAVRSEATLVISDANADEWTIGDMRYNNGMMINWGMLHVGVRHDDGATTARV